MKLRNKLTFFMALVKYLSNAPENLIEYLKSYQGLLRIDPQIKMKIYNSAVKIQNRVV